jgi:hypothetical protein
VHLLMFIAPPLFLCAAMLGGLHRRLTRRKRVPPPDPAFRKPPVDEALQADEHWAGVEYAWRRFLDDFAPVMETER